MVKLELRIDRDQADMLVHALSLAEDAAVSRAHKDSYRELRSWIRYRRIRKWGDEYAERVAAELTGNSVDVSGVIQRIS